MIDLRSDTVTRPDAAMLDAIARAPLGDDLLGDDPTVRLLEDRVGEILGKPSACFVPSGTMANLCAIRALTEPGDELIVHEHSHIADYEGGGYAAVSGCAIRYAGGERGIFDADEVRRLARPALPLHPRSRVVVVENTSNFGGGSVWSLDGITGVVGAAKELGLRLHLDGARLWNACAASGVAARDYAGPFDTVSVAFSKGLGAPAGSCVAADAETIDRVRRFRKMFGGSMRQSGVLAACCIHALDHNLDRLVDDHANARRFAEGVSCAPGVTVRPAETNIVFFDVPGDPADWCARWAERGVLAFPGGPGCIRAVTHRDVSAEDIDQAVSALLEVAETTP